MITMAVSNKRPIYRRVREWTRLDIHVAFGVPIERPAQRRSTVDFRTEFDTGPQLSLGGIRALAYERKAMFVKWTPRPPAVDLHFEHQTTNLGVRSSNFFGRASFLHSPCDSHGIHTARKSLSLIRWLVSAESVRQRVRHRSTDRPRSARDGRTPAARLSPRSFRHVPAPVYP